MLRIAIRPLVRRRVSPLALLRSLIAFLVAGLSAGWLLSACTPAYDWRTIMNNDNGYTVDLPAKPTTDERKIDIGGTPMDMSMQIAEADGAVFAVGTVMLPSDDPQVQRTALDFLRSGLAHNLGTAPNAHATEIPLAAGGEVPGLEMTFSGKAGPKQETRTMHARLVAKGRHVYQAAVIASKEPPPEQIEQFFGSFKLY
ncbi:conserved hypothetical protein [Paraburkholderia sabiae]|uniref:hypothetical protein n=1 Tax=Paraburkholderia sabiae TaxID=273251 RepID=UPI001CB09E70|nr:hypothetical protein [Paraburkholderia sabiae]CAG9236889.1 conserved hypothetical protein [Paraburkholderia sabiae]